MPAQDGTGPMGQGAMTGRGLGICRQVQREQLNLTKEQEIKILEARLKELKK